MAARPNPRFQSAEHNQTALLRDFDIPDADIEVLEYKRDEKIDEAKDSVLAFLTENGGSVF
jgi:hypothetical protein